MMKRVMSFFLCFIMVLGLAAPAVQASSTEDIYIEEGSSVSELSGNASVDTDMPDVEVLGPSEEGFSAVQTPAVDYSNADEVLCDCGVESDELLCHSDSCAQKRFCIELCLKSAMDIYSLWYCISIPERAFVKEYLRQYYPDTLDVLQKIWNSDMITDENDLTDYIPDMPMQYTGEASVQVGDITVDAHGIPEGSSLTVTDPAKKIVNAVENMAVELGDNPEQLFLYDISIENEETDNWQPEGESVYMTLSVPGLKLHRYATVYVIHVDDDGNASTIQASVDENGDIAFFTDGFSTFAGFTVDFKYGDAFFSIDGMTDIKLSQLFDELRMPLYASDVADLQFTDETLVSVTRLEEENDWLLTSLQAFTTQEILTVTMKDGNVFKINVTDATAFIYVGGGGYGLGTRYDLDGNQICTWYADGDGELDTQGYLNSAQNDGWSRTNTIYIGGSGKFTIGIKPWTNVSTKESAHILLNQIPKRFFRPLGLNLSP